MNTKQQSPFSVQLRQAIDQSGLSRYGICKRANLDQAVMHRFMNGKSGLSMSTIDAICQTLGLQLAAEDQPKKRKGR